MVKYNESCLNINEFFIISLVNMDSHDIKRLCLIPSVSTGIEPKGYGGPLMGNSRTTFEERTSLLLFREGYLTKC